MLCLYLDANFDKINESVLFLLLFYWKYIYRDLHIKYYYNNFIIRIYFKFWYTVYSI